MSKTTQSAFEILEQFPTDEAAREHLEAVRWQGKVRCPVCESDHIYHRKAPKLGFYDCRECQEHFTVRTGTVFERSHIPLRKWIYAIYQLLTARKGISSLQLSKEIGVTQRSAWFLLHRLRTACDGDLESLRGIVEADEAYLGGKESNKHEDKKAKAGRGPIGKQPIIGLRERGGKVRAMPLSNTDHTSIHKVVLEHVEQGSTLCTDEHSAYKGLEGSYDHHSVRHSAREFVNGMAHTNSIESFWALVKRGYNGVYHNWDMKNTARYLAEFSFRLNEGAVKHTTMSRIDALLTKSVGKRLTYKELIGSPMPSPIQRFAKAR